jgi:hypothetical protein
LEDGDGWQSLRMLPNAANAGVDAANETTEKVKIPRINATGQRFMYFSFACVVPSDGSTLLRFRGRQDDKPRCAVKRVWDWHHLPLAGTAGPP